MRKERATTHGKTKTRLYRIWQEMNRRCSPKHSEKQKYINYSKKGICVCEEWKGKRGFETFEKWALENGYDENAPYGKCTIDRIDNNGNYEPSNCRWADRYIQANNRSCVYQITYNGATHSVAEWSRIVCINESTLKDRLFRQGLTPSEAFAMCDRRKKIENA